MGKTNYNKISEEVKEEKAAETPIPKEEEET